MGWVPPKAAAQQVAKAQWAEQLELSEPHSSESRERKTSEGCEGRAGRASGFTVVEAPGRQPTPLPRECGGPLTNLSTPG